MSPVTPRPGAVHETAAAVVAALRTRGETLAVAESLTGGALASEIVGVSGASEVFRGGIVAYATEVKSSLLGVDEALLAERGPVDADVAAQMVRGVADRLGSAWALATTGVAGPGADDGHPAGEVFVALASPRAVDVRHLRLDGDRAQIRADAVSEALSWLVGTLEEQHDGSRR